MNLPIQSISKFSYTFWISVDFTKGTYLTILYCVLWRAKVRIQSTMSQVPHAVGFPTSSSFCSCLCLLKSCSWGVREPFNSMQYGVGSTFCEKNCILFALGVIWIQARMCTYGKSVTWVINACVPLWMLLQTSWSVHLHLRSWTAVLSAVQCISASLVDFARNWQCGHFRGWNGLLLK